MFNKAGKRVPIITIGGFLGAGKTTLINQLLSEAGSQRIVVFVNDFGAINIDYDLIETADHNRISLKNGCVCCTLNDDLIGGIQAFLSEQKRPDAFVIEASGVADPRALDHSILLLEQAGSVRLDNRVYLVDVDHFGTCDFEASELIIDHAAASDCVILNKADLVEALTLQEITEAFVSASPYASFFPTSFGRCPRDLILHTSVPERPSKAINISNHTIHHHGFASWSRVTERFVDRERFKQFAKALPQMCFRAKGQILFEDKRSDLGIELSIFHLVGHRASLETRVLDKSKYETQMVAIGKSETLPIDQLDHLFDELLI